MAKRYPNDHILQNLVGARLFDNRSNPETIELAITALNLSVELNPRNILVNEIEKIEHPTVCYGQFCGSSYMPLRGIRYHCFDGSFCSKCIERHKQWHKCDPYSIPTSAWIKAHFPLNAQTNIEVPNLGDGTQLTIDTEV